MPAKGSTGASLGGNVQLSPSRRKRADARRRREEKRWADKCGPVTIRFIEPEKDSVRRQQENG